MICVSFDVQQSITQNGRHLGVQVGDIVFDNLHPNGLPYEKWLQDFNAPFGLVVHSQTDF